MTTQFACERFVSLDDLLEEKMACSFTEADHGDLLEAALDQASDMLWLLSGGRITGVCVRTVRPFGDYQCGFRGYDQTEPGWMKDFGGVGTIPLRGPATNIIEIVIDGLVLGTDEYGLMDGRFLYRKSGHWPSNNDLLLDDTEDGTWSVTYSFGRPADLITRMAAMEIAVELANDLLGKSTNLPPGVTSAFIQGASVTVRERSEALREGGSQLPMLSRFLGIYAPLGPNRSGVYSPELKHGFDMVEMAGPNGS